MMQRFLFILTLVFVMACGQQRAYAPQHLSKLSEEQLFTRITAGLDPYTANIVYKNQRGDILTNNNVVKLMMTPRQYALDFYVDEEQLIQEGVIRPFTARDSLFQEKINKHYKDSQ